ncbi:amidase family protein [Streptomyces sp. NPDC059169]|uniref:amidase family protein n=1 Tax=Streptomyces sp. NPDC059169 TaxID=3346754 RepID=UPI00368A03FA
MLTSTEYATLTALDIARHVTQGALSAREIVSAALARLSEHDRVLRAFTAVWPEQALRRASEVDDQVTRGVVLPLAGVPIGVKATEGPGSFQNRRLVAAGCVPVGATSVPRGRHGWQTYGHTDRGPTLNPLHPEWSPGGSSAGSAAAVAAGLVPVASGSDGAGSVRIPAAWCGVFGYKTTNGLLPARDRAGLNCPGALTRTPQDAAAYLEAIAPAHARTVGASVPRATWSATLGFANTDPEVADVARRAARRLADAGLLSLADAPDLVLDDPAAAWSGLRSGEPVGEDVSATIRTNAHRLRKHFARADFIVTPTTPHPPHGHDGPGARMSVALTWAFNVSGHPAVSLPAGTTSRGEPVGLQLIARPHGDATLLKLACRAYTTSEWH